MKYWTGHRYFIHILELYCALASKKNKSIPDWHLFITQMETKWTKWYAMTSHVIAYRSLEWLFGTHTFHFNCFFMRILIANLRKYAAYLGCCLDASTISITTNGSICVLRESRCQTPPLTSLHPNQCTSIQCPFAQQL